jgi:hypothetical protein
MAIRVITSVPKYQSQDLPVGFAGLAAFRRQCSA